MATVNTNLQSSWQVGRDGKLESRWQTSPKEAAPVLKDTGDQVDIGTDKEEIDEQGFQDSMKKLKEFKEAVWFEFDKKTVKKMTEYLAIPELLVTDEGIERLKEVLVKEKVSEETFNDRMRSAEMLSKKSHKPVEFFALENDLFSVKEAVAIHNNRIKITPVSEEQIKGLESLEGKKLSKDELVSTLKGMNFRPEDMQLVADETVKTGQKQLAKVGLKTMKNSMLDFSKDGILAKSPDLLITGGQIALMIAGGTLCPPLLPGLGLAALGIVIRLLVKDANKRVQMKAQAKALSETTGIEQKYIEKMLEMEAKAAEQQKQLNKFVTKAMKDEDMDKWVTDVLKSYGNEDVLAKLEAGKNVDESFMQMLKRVLLGKYQPETVEARGIFLEMLLRGLVANEKPVEEFLKTQPEERQEAIKAKAEEIKQILIEQQKEAQAAAQAAQTQVQALTEQQQLALLNDFTLSFTTDDKMKEYTSKAFSKEPVMAQALLSEGTPPEQKMKLAMIALAKGLLEGDESVKAFTQEFAGKYPPEGVVFFDQVVSNTASALQQQSMQGSNGAGETQQTQETAVNLSPEERKELLADFTAECLKDESLKSFMQEVLKNRPALFSDLYSEDMRAEAKTDFFLEGFTLGLMKENPGVVALNEKITPKYQGDKEQFLSNKITEKADLIQRKMNGESVSLHIPVEA
ncbi:MAG: hypothetical protein ABRQ39_20075 [Candidatus Eremiobacterota bacterium]